MKIIGRVRGGCWDLQQIVLDKAVVAAAQTFMDTGATAVKITVKVEPTK